jgi:hypothetical protein
MKPLREVGLNMGGSIETDLNLILKARERFIWPGIQTRGRLLWKREWAVIWSDLP